MPARKDIEDLVKAIKAMETGDSLTIPGRGGWEMVISKAGEEFDFLHRCPDRDGRHKFFQYKFFQYNTRANPDGAGLIEQEPTLGLQCRSFGVNVDGCIVGALILGIDRKVKEKFSWSNLVFVQQSDFSISGERNLIVNGEFKGRLRAIFCPDKNCLSGYVGVFDSETTDEPIKVWEMEDIISNSIY